MVELKHANKKAVHDRRLKFILNDVCVCFCSYREVFVLALAIFALAMSIAALLFALISFLFQR